MMRKKILQLLHGLNTGGAEVLADRLGRRLSGEYDVVFACLDNVGEIGERLIASGYEVQHLRRGSGIDLGCVRRLAALIRSARVDVIHAHQYTPFFYAMSARMAGAHRPVVFTEHGRFLPDYPRHKRMVFNRVMLRRGDRLVAVGEAVRRALVENEGLPADRVETIYNGVPVDEFVCGGDTRFASPLREELGLKRGALCVVQVARLTELKDHGTAVRAIARAAESADIHLVVVGEGPQREAIEDEICRCRVSDRVHLLGLRQDIPRILAGVDVLLLSSISEGIPLTLIEGMAAGLPIVSTDVGGVSEIVEDEVHGLLCPAKDAVRLAEALVRLAAQPKLRQEMGRAGRERARERFAEGAMYRQYERMFSSILGDPLLRCEQIAENGQERHEPEKTRVGSV